MKILFGSIFLAFALVFTLATLAPNPPDLTWTFGKIAAICAVLSVLSFVFLPSKRQPASEPYVEETAPGRSQRGILLKHVQKPHKGEIWLLERVDGGAILRDGQDEVVMEIASGEAVRRIQFPSHWNRVSNITILGPNDQAMCFETNPATIGKVQALVQECMADDPYAAAEELHKRGVRDLLIGTGSLIFGLIVTALSFANAGPQNGGFYVMTGLIGVGLAEIVHGIYGLSKASSLRDQAPLDEAVKNHPEDADRFLNHE